MNEFKNEYTVEVPQPCNCSIDFAVALEALRTSISIIETRYKHSDPMFGIKPLTEFTDAFDKIKMLDDKYNQARLTENSRKFYNQPSFFKKN